MTPPPGSPSILADLGHRVTPSGGWRDASDPPTMHCMPEPPPTTVGPYRLLAELGRGGSGTVYRALAPDGQEVALKLQRPSAPDDALYLEREYRLQAELGGDGILPLLDQGQTPAGHYATFPLLSGGDLAQRLLRAPLPWPEAVELARVLARALARLHAAGVVHRDLKPANVLLDQDGRPWLADLGLSKHADRAANPHTVSLTATGVLAGTPGYMAPEQAADFKRAGPPADVFALGALLYAAIVGRDPFAAATLGEYLERSARGEARPLREAAPEAPRWLEALIAQALDPDPARRPRDAQAFLDALPSEVAPAPAGSPRDLRVVLAGLGALALVGALALASALRLELQPAATPSNEDPAPLLERAEAALDRGEFDAAWRDCTRALELQPSARAHFLRAVAAIELQRPGEALEDGRAAVELAPDDPAAYVARGRARFALALYDAAHDDARRALELDPDCSPALVLQAFCEAVRHDAPAALAASERALELDPASIDARLIRGVALSVLGRIDEALADLEVVLERAPWKTLARVHRADLYLVKQEPERAEEEARRAIEQTPGAANAYQVLGKALATLQRWAQAADAYRRAAELAPPNAQLYADLGECLLRSRDLAAAEVTLRQALAREDTLAQAWRCLAGVYISQERHEDAVAALDHAVALDPDPRLLLLRAQERTKLAQDWEASLDDLERALEGPLVREQRQTALALQASCLQRLDRLSEAVEVLDDLLEFAPTNLHARNLRSLFLLELKRPQEALEDAELLLKTSPYPQDRPLFLRSRGRAALQLGDVARAEADLLESLRLDPSVPDTRRALAELYLATERLPQALESARQAVELGRAGHEGHATLARVYEALDEQDAAREAWRAAAELAPPRVAKGYRAALEALPPR